MTATSEGKGIRCGTCGGTFPLATLAPGVACPYCGARQSMSSTAVVEAKQYREDVFQQMRAADRERDAAAAWGQWSGGTTGWLSIALVVSLVMFVFPVLLAVPGYLVAFGHVELPPALLSGLGTLGPICMVATMLGLSFGYAIWVSRRARSAYGAHATAPSAAGPASKVACPHCGAPNHLAPGQHVQTCAHCRGALVPSRTAMIAGLDAVRAHRRQASLERYRAERRGMLGITTYTNTWAKITPLFYVIPFAPMVIGVCLVPFGAVGGHVSPMALLVVGIPLLLVGALLAAGGAFLFVRWRQRRQAWSGALADLARQFHGRPTERVDELVAWLDGAWAGPYDVRFIGGGPRFGAVLLDAWGYAAAVALNPEAPRMNAYSATPTYARILVAAWIPSASEGGPPPVLGEAAMHTMEWLRAAGFLVSCEEGGLLAMAKEPVVEHLRQDPASAHQLAPVLGHLARLAHEIGAHPVGA